MKKRVSINYLDRLLLRYNLFGGRMGYTSAPDEYTILVSDGVYRIYSM